MSEGLYVGDVIYDIDTGISSENVELFDPTRELTISDAYSSHDVLVPVFKEGKLIYKMPKLQEIQEKAKKELKLLPIGMKRFLNPHIYPVAMEKKLYDMKMELIHKLRKEKYG